MKGDSRIAVQFQEEVECMKTWNRENPICKIENSV